MDSGEDPPPSWDEVVLNEGAWSESLLPPPSRLALAWRNRRYFIVVLVPLLLCPIPIIINNPVRFYQFSSLVKGIGLYILWSDFNVKLTKCETSAGTNLPKIMLTKVF